MRRATWILFLSFAAVTAQEGCSRSSIPMDIDGDGIPDDEDSEIGGWTDSAPPDDPGEGDDDGWWPDDPATDPGRDGTDPGGTTKPDGGDTGDGTASSTENPEDTFEDPEDTGSESESDTDTETDSIPYPPAAPLMWKCIICQ